MGRHPLALAAFALALLAVLLLAGRAWLQPSAARSSSTIGHAARFLPPTTRDAFFNDWSSIVADTRSVDPAPQEAGGGGFERALVERHLGTLRQITGGSPPRTTQEQWGWTFLDLDWELQIGADQVVLAFHQDFDPARLLDLVEERGYGRDDHHGQTTYHHAFQEGLPWMRWPFNAFSNLAYLEGERILLAAAWAEALQDMLDAHAGRTERWSGSAVAEAFGRSAEPPLAAMLLSASSACNLTPGSVAQVHPFDAVALTYHRDGEALLGTVAIGYADAATARLDLGVRSNLAREASGRTRGPSGRQPFQLIEARAAGEVLLLHLGSLAAPGQLFDLVNLLDVPFLACPAGDG